MQKQELTLGEWNNAKLAKWFEVSTGTFCNKKRGYLEQLRGYAIFHEERGKVIIEEILNPIFDSENKPRKSNKRTVKKEVNQPLYEKLKDGYGGVIIVDMAKDIEVRKGDELLKKDGTRISFDTIKQYVYESVREQLGTPGNPGPKGYRELILLIERDGEWRLPTKEEMSARTKIINKYYSSKESAEVLHNLLQAKKQEELNLQDVAEMLEAATDKGSKYWLCQQEIEREIGTFKQKTILHWLDSKDEISDEVKERIVKFFNE